MRSFSNVTFRKYVQGKKRAHFEFLVPHPHEDETRTAFLEAVIDIRQGPDDNKDHAYGSRVRYGP